MAHHLAVVAQLVRALDCGSKCRGFESRRSPSFSHFFIVTVTIWLAFFLGCVQGLTEFLPISSSGHLLLFQKLFGLEQLSQYVLFDIVCHLGTLLAILVALRPELDCLWKKKVVRDICLGSLPLLPLVLIVHPLKTLLHQPWVLSFSFFLSACFIWLGRPLSKTSPHLLDPFWIGLAQAIAILPGVSRSGATISTARALGWNWDTAFQFSFLLAIPAILGGTILEITSFSDTNTPFLPLLVGFSTSFFVGKWALQRVRWILKSEKWHYFGWYCLILGLVNLCILFF